MIRLNYTTKLPKVGLIIVVTVGLICSTFPILNLLNVEASVTYMVAGMTTDTPTNLTINATSVVHSISTKFSSIEPSATTLGVFLQTQDPRSDNGFVAASLAIAGFNIVDQTATTNNFICGTATAVKTISAVPAGGSGYAVNDILAITGGGGTGAQLKVLTITGSSVQTVQILNAGSGYTAGTVATTKITGAGNNAATVTITVNGAGTPTLNTTPASFSGSYPYNNTFGTGYSWVSITCSTQNNIAANDVVLISGFTATNPAVAATNAITYLIDIQDNDASPDEGFLAVPIIVNNNVSVSMAVTPYITLGLSATTANLGTAALNTVAATASPWIVLSTTTNAVSGEKIYVWDNNGNADTTGMPGGLYSSGASYTIHSDSNTSTTNLSTDMTHEHYDLNGGTAVAGLSIAAEYAGSDNTSAGGFLKNYSTLFATDAGVMTNGSSTIKFFSTVATTTPVGAYSDVVTFSAVGNF